MSRFLEKWWNISGDIEKKLWKKKEKKSSENDQSTGHFQSFFPFIFFIPSTLNLKILSRKSTNKKNPGLTSM